MARTGEELDGFRAALDLLLHDEAYFAWCEGRNHDPLTLEQRRELADFASVVGGDGTFHGTLHGKREAIGDGTGWASPSTSADDQEVPLAARVWHAVEAPDGAEPEPACGQGTLRWSRARPVNEMPTTAPRCTKTACQQRLVGA